MKDFITVIKYVMTPVGQRVWTGQWPLQPKGFSEGSVPYLKARSVFSVKQLNLQWIFNTNQIFVQLFFFFNFLLFAEKPLACCANTFCYGTNLQTIPQAINSQQFSSLV